MTVPLITDSKLAPALREAIASHYAVFATDWTGKKYLVDAVRMYRGILQGHEPKTDSWFDVYSWEVRHVQHKA